LTIRLNGVLQKLSIPPKERLVIRIPASTAKNNSTISTAASDMPTTDQDDNESADPIEDEDGELLDQVDSLLDGDDGDAEDGPDWLFEEGETSSSDPTYVFCPAPHRKMILRIFTKHFCQHPLFPERDGAQSAAEIHTNAVMEMYLFCRQRGLREVWGYLWSSWYSLKIWKLWARSSSPLISRLRTTMSVENFWRQLKHNYLHHMLRPRLDLLVWILINNITPEYIAHAEILEDTHRLGRSKQLTTYQRYFKKSWQALEATPVGGKVYVTDVAMWTCNCGQQKYQCHHLCKHLVHAVLHPPISFWRGVIRRRVAPLYRHPALVPQTNDGEPSSDGEYANPDSGSITEGDDHVWLGNPEMLKDGRWREFDVELMIGKRPQSALSDSVGDDSSSPDDHDMSVDDQHNAVDSGGDEEVCLILSFLFPLNLTAISIQLHKQMDALSICADELEEASAIIRSQLQYMNPIWIASMATRNIGRDASLLVKDVRHVEVGGRRRELTWAKAGDREAARRSRNTMGYQMRGT
jgi:hypothetical protein